MWDLSRTNSRELLKVLDATGGPVQWGARVSIPAPWD